MKNFLSVLIPVFMVAMLITSCDKDSDAVTTTEDYIDMEITDRDGGVFGAPYGKNRCFQILFPYSIQFNDSMLVTAENREHTGRGLFAVFNQSFIKLAEKTVFRAENCAQVDSASIMQQLDVADSQAIDTGLVGNQTDIGAGELPETISFKYINTCQHVAYRGRRGARNGSFTGMDGCVKDTPHQQRTCANGDQGRFQHTDKNHDRFH